MFFGCGTTSSVIHAAGVVPRRLSDAVSSAGAVPFVIVVVAALVVEGGADDVVVCSAVVSSGWVSSGSACHKGRPSHVFAALGLPKPWLDGALRISFSPDSTREEADRLVSALKGAADSLFTAMS